MNEPNLQPPRVWRNPSCELNVSLDEIENPSIDAQIIETLACVGDQRVAIIAGREARRVGR